MKKFILFLLILFVTGTTLAQGKLTPYDNVSLPAGLEEFIVNLENAVDQKDKKFIINHMSANMMNSFGGDGGINEFKEYWNWDSDSWIKMLDSYNKSRMMGDYHVRFGERFRLKLPLPI